ncbi:hypothetical protein LINPERPRIM_LOCUS37216 [Linum perenne]
MVPRFKIAVIGLFLAFQISGTSCCITTYNLTIAIHIPSLETCSFF